MYPVEADASFMVVALFVYPISWDLLRFYERCKGDLLVVD